MVLLRCSVCLFGYYDCGIGCKICIKLWVYLMFTWTLCWVLLINFVLYWLFLLALVLRWLDNFASFGWLLYCECYLLIVLDVVSFSVLLWFISLVLCFFDWIACCFVFVGLILFPKAFWCGLLMVVLWFLDVCLVSGDVIVLFEVFLLELVVGWFVVGILVVYCVSVCCGCRMWWKLWLCLAFR